MSEIVRWLSSWGLRDLQEIFEDNNIDLSVLPRLSEQDLKDLGIAIGDRRRLQAAIEKLAEPSPQTRQLGSDVPVARVYPPVLPRLRTAERRLLTVMFCDLVGSSALSTQLDPEDLNFLVSAYRDACAKPIEHYGGFISRFIGDGIPGLFRLPAGT